MEVLGAVSGSIQLLDAAINLSRRTYNLFRALKHAGEDVSLLRTALEETESLMRELRTYLLELQRSPSSTGTHPGRFDSLNRIVKLFSEDMALLDQALPTDTALSAAQKIRFVRGKKTLKEIVQRLQERKISAIALLCIINGTGDSRLRDEVSSMHREVTAVTAGQSALSGTLGTKLDDVTQRADLASQHQIQHLETIHTSLLGVQTSHDTLSRTLGQQYEDIASGVQSVHDSQKQGFDSLQASVNGLTYVQTSLNGMIESRLGEIVTGTRMLQSMQASHLSQRADLSSNNRLSVEDVDILARIVRAELKQHLEPLSHRLDGITGLVDSVVLAIPQHAHLLDVGDEEQSDTTERRTKSSARLSGAIHFQQATQIDSTEGSPAKRMRHAFAHHEVPLWSVEHWVRSTVCDIKIIIWAYRHRGLLNLNRGISFGLKISIYPRLWLCTRGLSIMGSSGPDFHGHYAMCPSIVSFRVIRESSPVYDMVLNVLYDDDLVGFQKLLSGGTLTLRDTIDEYNILQEAVHQTAINIVQYLMLETGSEAERLCADTVADDEDLWIFPASWLHFTISRHLPISRQNVTAILQALDLRLPAISSMNAIIAGESDLMFWALFDIIEEHYPEARVEYLIDFITLWSEYGGRLVPCPFYWDPGNSAKHLRLYLEAGGNPNEINMEGIPPLVGALMELSDGKQNHDMGVVEFLTLLIRAGADIYYMYIDGDPNSAFDPTGYAFHENIEEAWFCALEDCGFEPHEVFAESIRRRRMFRRLHGAQRSGVDVSFLEVQSWRKLRLRHPRRATEDE